MCACCSVVCVFAYFLFLSLSVEFQVVHVPIVMALRAIAQQRMGQREAALRTCDDISLMGPPTELLLETMMHVRKLGLSLCYIFSIISSLLYHLLSFPSHSGVSVLLGISSPLLA